MKTFPYAFARVSAMKAKLIATGDYHKMLKMDLSSITRYLQDSEYKDSITRLSSEFSGLELIDRALRRNEEKVYDKLRRICPDDVAKVIDLYLSRADFQNLKVILRGLYANASKDSVLALLEPVGKYNREHFADLLETGSVQKALRQSKIVSDKEMKEAYGKYKQSSRLIDIENQLDKLYYIKSITGGRDLDQFSGAYQRFLLRDIDVTNMRNLMRFKKENLNRDEIEDLLIMNGLRFNKKKLLNFAGKDLGALMSALNKTYYGKHVKFEGDIVHIELQLKKYHMKKAFVSSHRNPLSIQTILSYLMRKLIEIRNIRSLVKSKHLGIDMDFVENNILVV